MKKTSKKVQKNFRLGTEIDTELKRRSELTGIPETRIVEDALRSHFAESMQRGMAATLKKLTQHGTLASLTTITTMALWGS